MLPITYCCLLHIEHCLLVMILYIDHYLDYCAELPYDPGIVKGRQIDADKLKAGTHKFEPQSI